MSVTPEKKIPDDEIDLQSIRKKLSALISYPFFLLFSNVFTSLVFIVLAVLVAVSLKYFIPKSYTTSFILRPLDKNERTHLKILRDIQTLVKYHDYAALASSLQLDSNQVKSLQALQTLNPSLKNPADSVNTTEVVITSSDYSLFIPFQNALLSYLETSPYFAKIKELQTKQIDLEMLQVEKDLKNLDTLKALQIASYHKQVTTAQSVIAINELINPTATYTLTMERVYKKSNLIVGTMPSGISNSDCHLVLNLISSIFFDTIWIRAFF